MPKIENSYDDGGVTDRFRQMAERQVSRDPGFVGQFVGPPTIKPRRRLDESPQSHDPGLVGQFIGPPTISPRKPY